MTGSEPASGAATTGGRSPWSAALDDAVEGLHPRIRDYVRAIPPGSVGLGAGVFEVVGTPRRWLRPVLAMLSRQSVLVPGWYRRVPFEVRNRPGRGPDPELRAERVFALPGGSWTMRDVVSIDAGVLVDDLGSAGRYRAELLAWTDGGALRLRSTRIRIRVGSRRPPLPRLLAPVVQLSERFDDDTGRQHVHLRLEHPLLGVLYEYRGTFTYSIEEEAG